MCELTREGALVVPAWPEATGAARDFIRKSTCRHHATGTVDSACLVVTEFISDAILSARPPLWLHLDCWETVVSVTVTSDIDPELEQVLAGARARIRALADRILDGLVEARSVDRFHQTRIQWAVIGTDGTGHAHA